MTRNLRTKPSGNLAAVFGLFMLWAGPVMAQDLAPIQDMLETVEAALTGPIGIAVATLAVIGTGFMCMMGRLNWGWFASIVIGIVLIFSAGTIVAGFT
ncbi:MAG: TrbC/VirB2 family protein [Pseudomonadota bacterium]